MKMYPVLDEARHPEDLWRSGGIVPRILNLGSRWSSMVRFTSRPLYPRGKYLDTHLLGLWARPRDGFDAVVKVKNACSSRKSNSGHPARIIFTILTELPRLILKGYYRKCESG